GGCRYCEAFLEKANDELAPPRRGADIANRPTEETGTSGKRRQESPLFPHVVQDVGTRLMIKRGAIHHVADRSHTAGNRPVEFPVRNPVSAIEVNDLALTVK